MPTTKEFTAQQTKASLYTYFGDSLYNLKYFRRALRAYEQALSFNDSGTRRASKRCKTNSSSSIINNCDISKINSASINHSENELKHRIHLSYLELHEFKEAKVVLERIAPVERSIKVLASLANLYFLEKNYSKAAETYLEILRQDPLRLDIVVKLCKLSPGEADNILNLITDDVKKSCPWYPTWIQAQCHLHSPYSKKSISLFESLSAKFERRSSILTSLAEAHYYDGNACEAVRIFKIAYDLDPLTLSGVDTYAACLNLKGTPWMYKRGFDELAVTMSNKCGVEGDYFHEPWLVLAHYYASTDKKEPKALLFVQKAYKLNRHSIEALILLARLCLEKKDATKALPYILTAQTLAPYRYEVQSILCEAFLASNKKSVALSYAKTAMKSLGESARSYYLYADMMLKSHDQRRKNSARNCLEKAIKLDPVFLPAVLAYSKLLQEEKKYEKATEILRVAQSYHSLNTEINEHLYACHMEQKDYDKALYHQNLASDQNTSYRADSDSNHRSSQEPIASQDDVDPMIGLEADELVDQGDSEVDDSVT